MEPREGKPTYPSHLELHGVRVSPVHEGGVHFAAHAHATVPIVYVKAASSAVLGTHVTEDLSPYHVPVRPPPGSLLRCHRHSQCSKDTCCW